MVRRCRRLGALASSRFFSLVSLAIRESTQSGGLRKRIAQVGLYSLPWAISVFCRKIAPQWVAKHRSTD